MISEYKEHLTNLPDVQKTDAQKEILALLGKESVATDRLLQLLHMEQAYTGLNDHFAVLMQANLEEVQQMMSQAKAPEASGKTDRVSQRTPSKDSLNTIYYDVAVDGNSWDFTIRLRKPEEPVPTEIFLFIKSVDEVKNTLAELYANEADKKTSHLKTLYGIARAGGTSTYIELARQQLEQYKKEIILLKGSQIKLKYLIDLGLAALAVILLCLLLLLIPWALKIQYPFERIFPNGILLVMGSGIGTWLSFAIRKKDIAFEDLRILNGNMKNPIMRMLVMVLISLSFYLIFITGFLNIKIGDSFSTESVGKKGYESLAFLVGIFMGLAENSIGPTLTNRIETFTSKL